jgi:hypothetical protein
VKTEWSGAPIAVTEDVYGRIVAISEDATRSPAAFTGLLTPAPRPITVEEHAATQKRYHLVRSWQRTSLDLFAASVSGDLPPVIAASLLDHLPDHVGWQHHRRLQLRQAGTPLFFRTDQVQDGTILEVQCPGSLWGVHELLLECYAEIHPDSTRGMTPLSMSFTAAARQHRGAEPVIHHLLDNSSHPAGERFFIQRARRGARYFGFDTGVRAPHCNLVRAHDFLALLSENFAAERIQRLIDGDSVYDLPPIALFDQKLLLAFPYWQETCTHFSDTVRALFPYTTVLTPDGVMLEDGAWATLAEFASLSRRERSFFLKYAGSDVARNWGSRAVFHLGKLSRTACEHRLRDALTRYSLGERWILQRECDSEEEVTFITRAGGIETASGHSKHSIFYGPTGTLGKLFMFEDFYKVHGSSDTITTIGIPPDRTSTGCNASIPTS